MANFLMPKLSDIYGHEENLSRVIAEQGYLCSLLRKLDIEITDKAALELPVAKGHDNKSGRLDIYQPTSIGDVVVEVQYGNADYHHANRLQNYASNFSSTALVVWIAENFDFDRLNQFKRAKTPVYCVKASIKNGDLCLAPKTPKSEVLANQQLRIKKARQKALKMIKALNTVKKFGLLGDDNPENLCQITPGDYLLEDTLQSAAKAYIEYQLRNYPKKSLQFLWTSPDFIILRESLMDEIACFSLLTVKEPQGCWEDNFLRTLEIIQYTQEDHDRRCDDYFRNRRKRIAAAP
ncbi:hypothetical protein [Synechococcus sp. A15-60]|uniref:hypothetical protein n=1 Tax=Synechococcus sp. A15-60 TaxID=1050655 RepID=UPI0016492B91|nr:hypothetical protein [Synechococcus sp. A15-60]QNI48857.1 hypothetical protein SynA1560_02208 [Synechococcus sp. A15-60]